MKLCTDISCSNTPNGLGRAGTSADKGGRGTLHDHGLTSDTPLYLTENPLKNGLHQIGDVVIKNFELYKSININDPNAMTGMAFVNPADTSSYSDENEEGSFIRLEQGNNYYVSSDLGFIRVREQVSQDILGCTFSIADRQTGEIIKVEDVMVTAQDLKDLLSMNCNEKELLKFETTHELDSAVMLSGLRFRANFYKTLNGLAAVLRRVESKIPLMEDLNLPQVLFSLLDVHKGLVLVTGPTGSGKSTTLAAIINQINESRPSNIITIEDPVEFIHKDKKSIVSQREVGKQTESFARALKAALREDPDVILVGELRDLETIGMALTAAETGHLVFGTLHTSGAPNTVNRIIDAFPPEQQGQIRAQLAESLNMVVTQKLFKKKDGSGRVGAFEIMVCNPPIKNLIREGKIHQIPSVMQTGQREGMITMEKSIENLIGSGVISSADKNS